MNDVFWMVEMASGDLSMVVAMEIDDFSMVATVFVVS